MWPNFAEGYKNRADAYEKLGQIENAASDRKSYDKLQERP
jgi:hypothetical protein